MENQFKIRKLNKEDINQIANARREQENENGNGATDEYILWYKKITKKLFEEKRLISAGAFKGDELVSIACFNLINFGSEKKIPYLCAVWTNPEYRGMRLATKVYKKLTESMLAIKEQLEPKTLLTLEGNDAALHLYKKIGYKDVSGEMTFLSDVQSVDNIQSEESQRDAVNKRIVYILDGKPLIGILYSEEQFFSHPANIDGKMSRIIAVRDLRGNASLKTINLFLQQFLSEHRFCKFNVEELAEKEKRLYEILGVENGDIEGLLKGFENMTFIGKDGQTKRIKRSSGIMEKNLYRDFEDFDQEDLVP